MRRSALPRFRVLGYGLPTLAPWIPRSPMAVAKNKPAAASAARRPAAEKPGKADEIPAFSKDDELKAYHDMLLIRRFEEKAGQMYGMGLIGGFCHLYIGQEAGVVGMQMTLQPRDEGITRYRDPRHMPARGRDPQSASAELA